MTATTPGARFDDLVAGTALRCPPPDRVLVAERADQVAGVLAEVERATAAGSWAFGWLAYEAAPGLDPSLPVAEPAGDGPPLAWFGLCGAPEDVPPVDPTPGDRPPVHWAPDWTDDEHARAVAAVREHIAAGETYQCNLTDRLRARDVGDPARLYADLALAQRGAYNALLDTGRFVVASASPELFFEWDGARLRTRPMKGTAARGRNTAEDATRAAALRASAKEQAENLMIVDLLRNDVARVAEVGSVAVPELFALERYPTVWQLTSEVTGRTRDDVGLVDVLRALFPCGSITGAPKRRTMQLIADLEPRPRGVYCGAVGLVAPPGAAPFRARFNVAIRTVVVDRATGAAVYGVGGGITWGSDPGAERAEVRAKAAVLTEPAGDHQLIETMALADGRVRDLDRHLARLTDSAAFLGFTCDPARVRAAVAEAVAGRATGARVRLLLDRDGAVTVDLADLPAPPSGPVRLVVDPEPVDSASRWLQHKTTRREVYTARAARHPDADDVVLVNERGEVTETTVATLAVRIGGTWWTPPVDSGCLPGVARGRLLAEGVLRERVLRVADLAAAEELALVSSLRGWRPAVLAEG
ncbi:aminodeoxychorismate synthase component I [Modestobacter roseus]|uniref:Para-aminobenzoate synthetase/4-amino-4-deoxychorismate lyase n=1 Tax=Modestobacter roseus TaxID=1181884 RepID=A0A562IPV4_9ACTN|nr:aminodeoxychorismate synthase component I [Modestobacter roseus]MQA34467.1 aminodeoxychorismate synthase component I [Modestobacter roseus]TWH73047.1 para-aminobenzoate synthetase/4-amino-4-deoxychorismate lyase [Modestobacter roseus]